MIPELIQAAVSKVGGSIQSCLPACEGSRHFIVTFAAPKDVPVPDGAASLDRTLEGVYRADFILNEK